MDTADTFEEVLKRREMISGTFEFMSNLVHRTWCMYVCCMDVLDACLSVWMYVVRSCRVLSCLFRTCLTIASVFHGVVLVLITGRASIFEQEVFNETQLRMQFPGFVRMMDELPKDEFIEMVSSTPS